jgi:uncharacterized protein Yka (UPF0111/DUF47 family)
MKTQVIETLGEKALTLPAQVEAGLAANDRLKFYFTLLQVARNHADQPDQPASSLKQERVGAGIDDAGLDRAVQAAHREGELYRVPGAHQLMAAIAGDARLMAAPVDTATKKRLQQLAGALPKAENDLLEGSAIDNITRADSSQGDTLHRLVMDLHKQLNALQASLAEENIEGAAAYHLREGDRALVRAFMVGLNRTAPLKFNHPGLGTTATSSGPRLIIQNDIGTTDAHVIVIHIEGMKVTLTYSDVHLERLQFFRLLLAQFAVTWTNPNSSQSATLAGGAPFFLSTCSFAAKDREQLLAYLDHLGSRLVFLIDWNRARKQLRGFLKGDQRLRLLCWAADTNVGHRGFLELGGAQLIWGAVETAGATAIHLGDRLSDVLGDESAFAFVQFTFKTATEGLLAHQSDSLIRDRIRAELLTHLNTAEARLLAIALDHAGLIFEIATGLRDRVLAPPADGAKPDALAKRARHWEHEADALVVQVATSVRRRPELQPFHRLIEAADDAADQLEEVAFLLCLLEGETNHRTLQSLQPLASILAEASQEWVKALGHAQHVQRHGPRDDADEFLTAIDRLSVLEHDADEAERAVSLVALRKAADFRELHLLSKIGQGLGEASDSLKRASIILRDHVLGDVLAA